MHHMSLREKINKLKCTFGKNELFSWTFLIIQILLDWCAAWSVSTDIHHLYVLCNYFALCTCISMILIFLWKGRWIYEKNRNATSEWISIHCGNLLANKHNIVTTTYRVPKQIALISGAKNYHRNLIFLMCPNTASL